MKTHPIFFSPLRNVSQARRLLRYLHDKGLQFHPEDPTADIVDPVTGPQFSADEAQALDARMDEAFAFGDKWGAFGDPCGYCMAVASAPSGSAILDDYITAALWSSTNDDGEPLDCGDYTLADETRAAMEADCGDFLAYVEAAEIDRSDWDDAQLGHDFWLTRNGHGVGFWDRFSQTSCDAYEREQAVAIKTRDFSKRDALDDTCPCAYHCGQRLTRAAEYFGQADLYVGDDGRIYQA